MNTATFSSQEITVAFSAAVALQIAFFVLLASAGTGGTIVAKEPPPPKEIPIEVLPVLDDTPLLKLGGKKVKNKLPDMWRKPKPVKRHQMKNAPSTKAEKTPEAIPKEDPEEEPPEDAELAKEVDEDIPDTDEEVEEANLPEEGAADGVKEGTETDPLKARAVSQYKMKLIGWFNRRFQIPPGVLSCEELKVLSAGVQARVGPNREVSGYSIVRPSGNPTFDGFVTSTMQRVQGQVLPPPPPKYPDILESILSINMTRKFQPCP